MGARYTEQRAETAALESDTLRAVEHPGREYTSIRAHEIARISASVEEKHGVKPLEHSVEAIPQDAGMVKPYPPE